MTALEFLREFEAREGQIDILRAQWYIVAVFDTLMVLRRLLLNKENKAAALTAACAGEQVAELYHIVTRSLPLESKKIVQRRIKEAILKGSILYGVPRTAQVLGPLFRSLPDDEIDCYSPRYHIVVIPSV